VTTIGAIAARTGHDAAELRRLLAEETEGGRVAVNPAGQYRISNDKLSPTYANNSMSSRGRLRRGRPSEGFRRRRCRAAALG
jgi:hypothetical protein